MTNCSPISEDPFRCPSKWELWLQILALLPRGRAWQTHETSPEFIVATESAQLGVYRLGSTGLGTEPIVERMTVLQRFWASYAEVLEFLHQRACALIDEFYCATTTEMLSEWGIEYGFPDSCEPWETLCDKVKAQGGATCAYLASLASRLGYEIECVDCGPGAAEAGCAEAGVASPCICPPNLINIRILTARSPAYVAPVPFEAGAAVAGCTPPCAVAPESVVCLIERFKPAHIKAIYEVI